MRRISLKEHQISLEDSLVQIMTSPEEFNFLNFDASSAVQVEFPRDKTSEDLVFAYNFDLSQSISVEHRYVLSFPELFGILGGLYEFLASSVIFLVGHYNSSMFKIEQI